jgi:putative endonuclease
MITDRHMQTGRTGEELAAEWLRKRQFEILERNWRSGRFEIDLIAEKCGVLHFIEVKTGRTIRFGFPERRVDRRKILNMLGAAEQYLSNSIEGAKIQLDVISISIFNDRAYYFFIEDVYL